MPAPVGRAPFGRLPDDGRLVEVFTLTNIHGVVIRAMNFGARILSVVVPDRNGVPGDIALGYRSLEDYLNDTHYLGAVVGRYANRIRQARFSLGGTMVRLSANEGPHHLHGGFRGFDKRYWDAALLSQVQDGSGVTFSCTSPDGEEGYPGTLHARVTYLLTDRNQLAVLYQATSDRTTPVNLTQHTAFNLAGEGQGDVLGHELQIAAGHIVPVDDALLPGGALRPVEGTPFDFRNLAPIGRHIADADEQLRLAGGYDHTFVLHRHSAGLLEAARVRHPASGREVTVSTTEPGLHLYTGNFLSPTDIGKTGLPSVRHGGLCLETQHFPDSPNQPGFPSVLLQPGTEYRSRTVFGFGIGQCEG